MIGEAQVGPSAGSDGAKVPLRVGKDGALMVQDAHGVLLEAALRGKLFSACTAVSGVAPGTSLGTTAAFCLSNPAGSSVNLVILSARIGYVSGTLGAGVVVWAWGARSDTPVTGTAIVPVAGILGGGSGQAKPFTTATIPATPIVVRSAFILGASLATTALGPYAVADAVNGAIVVPPGCSINLHGVAAAGTTPLVIFDVQWEEVAV